LLFYLSFLVVSSLSGEYIVLYLGPQDTSPKQPMQTGTNFCQAGYLCRLDNVQVIVTGKEYNGGVCCKCEELFHNTCLYVHERATYCFTCFKQYVVSQCSTETLFADVLSQLDNKNSSAGRGLQHNAKDLVKFVDKFLQEQNMSMTLKGFCDWRDKSKEFINNHPCTSLRDKKMKNELSLKFMHKREKYDMLIKLAKQEWMLSTDGVVKALRYRAKDKQFVAQVHYKKGTRLLEEKLTVSDDWVIDTYGKEIASKLIDRDKHQEFIKPVNDDGMLTVVKLDERKIIRVKYLPPKFMYKYDETRGDHITDQVYAKGIWRGQLEDGTVMPIPEELIKEEFGSRFVKECKRLGHKKFVDIPVGSCRLLVMALLPELRSG